MSREQRNNSHTTTPHRQHPQRCSIRFAKHYHKALSSSYDRVTSQRPRGRRPQRIMELQVSDWQVKLLGEVYKTGHSIRSASMRSLLVQPQEIAHQGSPTLMRLLSRHERQGTPAQTHSQVHQMLGRFRLLWIIG